MNASLNPLQEQWNRTNPYDFSMLKAVILNCTLKPSPELSHTEGLMAQTKSIMEANGVTVKIHRPVDYQIPPGVYPDMTDHGFEKDDWPELQQEVLDANILIIGTPIWLGERSSVASKVIERLYGYSGYQNENGQYLYYGRAGGVIITGNEDGVKHCAMNTMYALQHLGYVIPPQADAGWIGEAGPGPSYLDEGSGGPQNDFTNRNTTFMTWNLMHMAKLLHQQNGLPAHGNQRSVWEAGANNNQPNPEYR